MTSSGTPAKKQELWRSKLGTDYPKEYMEKNEQRLFKELQEIRDLPENRTCADCGARGTVLWASVNLGVFLCMTWYVPAHISRFLLWRQKVILSHSTNSPTFSLLFLSGAHHRSLGTHISKPKGATGSYWWGEDELAHMRSHGNAWAKEVYGDSAPPNGVTVDDAVKWRQYLTDKYVHKKYAPSPGRVATLVPTKTPPPTPIKFSPRTTKNTKFTHLPMPNIDLIHFGSPESSSAGTKDGKVPLVSPTQSKDFFADFGL